MELVALTLWIATAVGGLYMLGITLRSGSRPDGTAQVMESNLPPLVVFGHASLALGGLLLWAVHMAIDEAATAWTSLAILLLVAGGGSLMFLQWRKDRQGTPEEVQARVDRLAEQQIPSPVVHMHGALALLTILAVLYVAVTLL